MEESHDLNPEESLRIITQMIQSTKQSIKGSSFYFLFWGWLALLANIAQYYLQEFTDFASPHMIWLIAIPGWIITVLYSFKYNRNTEKRTPTYGGRLIMWTWIGFVISIVIIIGGGMYFNYQITALIMLFAGFATFITGLILKFKPLIIGGSTFWILTPVALWIGIQYSPIIMAIGLITGYLIPGYLLKNADE